MNKIEELINELCPDGVEFKRLGDVCDFKNGFAFQSSKFQKTGLPILRITNINYNGYIDDNQFVYFNNSDYKEDLSSYIVEENDIVVAMSGATTGKISINKTGKELYLNQRVGKFIPNEIVLENRYLYHWLLSQSNNIYNASSGVGAQPNLSSEKMKNFKIPVPPIEIQREIVKILDNFTQITAELTAELTARKQQYEFYREKVLYAEGPTVKIADICDKTKNIKWNETDKNYNYIDLTSVDRFSHTITTYNYVDKTNAPSRAQQIVKTNDILFATTRPTLQRYSLINEDLDNQICSTGFCVLRPKTNEILPMYLYFIISSNKFFDYILDNQQGASYPAISDFKVKNFSFILPDIEKQKEIVEQLDKFSKLCEDISEGLPAEIEARKKQYEYYRDKLLTFKEKAN